MLCHYRCLDIYLQMTGVENEDGLLKSRYLNLEEGIKRWRGRQSHEHTTLECDTILIVLVRYQNNIVLVSIKYV